MNRRYFAVLGIFWMLIGLSGCRLAIPEAGETGGDRLIGAYISYDYISQGEEVKVNAFGEILIETNDEKGKVYAVKNEEIMKTEEGNKYTNTEFDFPDITGVKMFVPKLEDPLNKKTKQIKVMRSDGITDINVELDKPIDKKNRTNIKGTIYQDVRSAGKMLFINPVFQTIDGRVYLRKGKGLAIYGDQLSGNFRQITTWRDSSTVNDGGMQRQEETVVELTVELESAVEEVIITQMDQNNEIINTKRYKAKQIPESILPEKETEYLITEMIKGGEKKTERQIWTKDQTRLSYLRSGEDGILIQESIEIQWKTAE